MKTLILLVISLCATYASAQNASQINITGSNSVDTIAIGIPQIVDDDLSIVANGVIEGWTVTITGSYTTGDVIGYNGSLPSGVTASAFNTATRSMQFTGTVTAATWQEFLRRITITTYNTVCTPEQRRVSFNAGYVIYNPLNGHFYEVYTTNSSWTNGAAYAGNQSFYGVQGYLCTVTSAAEDGFIEVMVNTNSWIGNSDNYSRINEALGYTAYANQAASEGKWYWVTGPEKGTQIRYGNASGTNIGSAVSGQYQNWSGAEPNNWGGPGEGYGHMYSNGVWNDFANTQSIASIIEYGGLPTDNPTFQLVFTKSLFIDGTASGTLTGGNVDVCSGSNSTTISLTGLVGTVDHWESSVDDFLTAGTTIASTSTSLTVSNITTTTYYRAVVNSTSPSCSNLTTSSTPVNVTNSVGGTITAINNTICAGGDVALTLFGSVGSVLSWEVDDNSSFTSPTTIANTTTDLTYALGSTGTYYFRAEVQNNGCGSPVYSATKSILVNSGTPATGGTLSSISECSSTNSGALTLSGSVGSVTKWQYSIDGGLIWNDISNTSTSNSYSNVSENRTYRVQVTNGSCGSAYSSFGLVTIIGQTSGEWLGTQDSLWENANNWKCSFIPTTGMDILVNASAPNDMYLDQDRSYGSIDFNGANIDVYLQEYDLTVADFSNTDENNFFRTEDVGALIINIPDDEAKLIPIGQSSYNPVRITNHTGASDVFTFNVHDSVMISGTAGNVITTPHVERTWHIGKTSANAEEGIDFEFFWHPTHESETIAGHSLNHHNGSNWDIPSSSTHDFNASTNSLVYEGYTGTFSPFAIAASSPLPVSLVDISVECIDAGALLNWQTASEINSEGFVVQFSDDLNSWVNKSDMIASAGTSTQLVSYQYVDTNRMVGYYRLAQYDFDGAVEYYGPLRSECRSTQEELSMFPNPTNNAVNIAVGSHKEQAVQITVQTKEGRFIENKTVQIKKGNNLIPYDMSGLAAGVYIFLIVLGGIYFTRKIVKL